MSLNGNEFVCTDRNGTVCTYKYREEANNYEFDKIVYVEINGDA